MCSGSTMSHIPMSSGPTRSSVIEHNRLGVTMHDGPTRLGVMVHDGLTKPGMVAHDGLTRLGTMAKSSDTHVLLLDGHADKGTI